MKKQYWQFYCGCGRSPIDSLTYRGLGLPANIVPTDHIKSFEKGICRICGQHLKAKLAEVFE